MATSGFPGVQEKDNNEVAHRAKLARSINAAMQGKLNATGTVTLTASATSTTLTDPRLTVSSFIEFMATTSDAATAKANIYVTNQNTGTAKINHASNAAVDQTFTYLIIA